MGIKIARREIITVCEGDADTAGMAGSYTCEARLDCPRTATLLLGLSPGSHALAVPQACCVLDLFHLLPSQALLPR